MPSPLSFTGKHWRIRRKKSFTSSDDIPILLARERKLLPGVEKLSDPFMFSEMKAAVQRIEHAMASGEMIGIFGDYDADGITGVAQLVRFFRRHNIEPIVHLPDRLSEGYGLQEASLRSLAQKGVSLLITVDTGVTAHGEIALAKTLGMDVIVTDHHRPRAGRPPALAVLHPEIPSPTGNPHLCGSGVALTLVRALEHGKVWDGVDVDIVLAMIGTIGDVVPLVGENRLLVLRGLKMIDGLGPSALRELIDAVRSPGKPLTAGDIAFRVVPRINAAGRLRHPSIALEALLSGGRALEELHRLNSERQTMVEDLLEHARTLVHPEHPFIVIRHETFTPGVVGLIAGRLTDEYGRPSLVGSALADRVVCSLRSVSSVDVMACLQHPDVQPNLLTYGGHTQAAGCTFLPTAFDAVSIGLSKAIRSFGLTDDDLTPELAIESELPPELLGTDLARSLQFLAPFGAGNEEPVFLLRNVAIANPRIVGSDGRHLQCRINDVKAIGFGLGSLLESLPQENLDVAGSISLDTWNGREEPQIILRDMRKR
jgi:single-stranded-DNA-specific exonuclease